MVLIVTSWVLLCQIWADDVVARSAEEGDPSSQYSMGLRYFYGLGGTVDREEAVKWFTLAANNGLFEAQKFLAKIYNLGEGVPKNKNEAFRWAYIAACQGDVECQAFTGWYYWKGEGVERNDSEAVIWLRKAAENDHAIAQFNLATCYAVGEGVPLSGAAAADWFFKAGLNSLKAGNRDQALLCVDRIKQMNSVLRLNIPNMHLADELLEQIYDGTAVKKEEPSQSRTTSSGTAWVVSSHHVVTNFHVIEGSSKIRLIFPDGASISAEVDSVDKVNDLALLRVASTISLPPALTLAASIPRIGAGVFTVGYPHPDFMGQKPKLTSGIISATSGLADDSRFFQITVSVQAGNSGGPLLNLDGQVVGVVVAKLNAATVFRWTGDLPENVNYAIKIAYLRALAENKIPTQATPSLGSLARGNLETVANRVMQSVAIVTAE